jgi:uncharacterized protein (DUF4415 family)
MAGNALLPSAGADDHISPSSIRGAAAGVGLSRQEGQTVVKKVSSKSKPAKTAGPVKTDWARVDALTDEEIEAAVRDDPDAAPIVDEAWFASAKLVMPQQRVSLELDRDVLEHFRKHPGYQTRINAILRAAMEHEKKTG